MLATATQLHRNTTEVLRKAHELGSVVITLRGKPVVKMVSLQPENLSPLTQYPAVGMWKDREDMKDPAAWVRKIRRPRYRFSLPKKT